MGALPAFTDIIQKRKKAQRPKWFLADIILTLSETDKSTEIALTNGWLKVKSSLEHLAPNGKGL